MNKLLTSLTFPRGKRIKNRFMLAPITNTQIDAERVMSESI
jgi:2,4-dienoyl-CoA reductase-like NADH-dependent reductase (Old Yellow Enzyme family)